MVSFHFPPISQFPFIPNPQIVFLNANNMGESQICQSSVCQVSISMEAIAPKLCVFKFQWMGTVPGQNCAKMQQGGQMCASPWTVSLLSPPANVSHWRGTVLHTFQQAYSRAQGITQTNPKWPIDTFAAQFLLLNCGGVRNEWTGRGGMSDGKKNGWRGED